MSLHSHNQEHHNLQFYCYDDLKSDTSNKVNIHVNNHSLHRAATTTLNCYNH